jgi:hypothetical protein
MLILSTALRERLGAQLIIQAAGHEPAGARQIPVLLPNQVGKTRTRSRFKIDPCKLAIPQRVQI